MAKQQGLQTDGKKSRTAAKMSGAKGKSQASTGAKKQGEIVKKAAQKTRARRSSVAETFVSSPPVPLTESSSGTPTVPLSRVGRRERRGSATGTGSGTPAVPLAFAPGLEAYVKDNKHLERRCRQLEEVVQITVAPKTRSGQPIQEARGRFREAKLDDYRPDENAVSAAVERLKGLGFDIIKVGRFGITVRGHARLVNEVLKAKLTVFARPHRNGLRSTRNFSTALTSPVASELFVAPHDSLTIKSTVSENIDHFLFIPPPLFFAPPVAIPPEPEYHHLQRKAIRELLHVPNEFNGKGVKIALVDTGFFPHPFYTKEKYSFRAVDTVSAPDAATDTVGHGTAIALNAFAVAPKVEVLGFKQSNPPQDAVEDAANAGVDVLSCSWGWDHEQSFPILEATIRSIIQDDGIIVLFAAGNGHFAWPGSMPEVLSVGGVFADKTGELEASNYASGFISSLYPPRRVPDVSGLCGPTPRGVYIPMPCPPGCEMDRKLSGGEYPDGDQTKALDGWVVASGTSSATPQIAGVVALLVQKAKTLGKKLSQTEIRRILEQTARPVEKGRNAFGFPAVGQPNTACGFGLVDAAAAVGRV